MCDLICDIVELYLTIEVSVTRVRYKVSLAFLLFILAVFLTITANYYRAQDRCDFLPFHFKVMKLEYCNNGPPIKRV